jgi:hypothetical protein
MDCEPDVFVAGHFGFSGMDPNPHANGSPVRPRMARECTLRGRGRQHRVPRAVKGDEERISLCVKLAPAVRGERLSEEPLVLA